MNRNKKVLNTNRKFKYPSLIFHKPRGVQCTVPEHSSRIPKYFYQFTFLKCGAADCPQNLLEVFSNHVNSRFRCFPAAPPERSVSSFVIFLVQIKESFTDAVVFIGFHGFQSLPVEFHPTKQSLELGAPVSA